MLNQELLKILVCPESKQPVTLEAGEVLSKVNASVRAGTLKARSGDPITEEFEALLLRQDGQVAYGVRHGIPVMLIDESFAVPH